MSKRKERLLERVASRIIGVKNTQLLLKGLDVVGDIAILKFPDELEIHSHPIAEELLEEAPYIKVVLEQSSPVSGDHRLRGYRWLAGEKRTTTLHKEFGCIFKVDVEKAYFSPRLSTERDRIASQIENTGRKDEVVLNMFAGVGCFSILIAKRNKSTKIYSVDINRYAFEYMVQNVYLNKVRRQVVSVMGDAGSIIRNLFHQTADRVLMPLPEKGKEYLSSALEALKPEGGIIHYQTFIHAEKDDEPIETAEKEVDYLIKAKHEITDSRVVRAVGTRWYHVAEDIRVWSSNI